MSPEVDTCDNDPMVMWWIHECIGIGRHGKNGIWQEKDTGVTSCEEQKGSSGGAALEDRIPIVSGRQLAILFRLIGYNPSWANGMNGQYIFMGLNDTKYGSLKGQASYVVVVLDSTKEVLALYPR